MHAHNEPVFSHELITMEASDAPMHIALARFNAQRLRSYEADSGLLREHHGVEEAVLAGGYGYRQILELVQNGADALLEAQESGIDLTNGRRIEVRLHDNRLYVANTGTPLSEEGLNALLRSHSSPKRGNQIGRFGLGFKTLLKLNGRIDIFTRAAGAIRFDPERCRSELRERFDAEQVPALRLAWPLPPEESSDDPVCCALAWAETIIRVEVGSDELFEHLQQEIRAFPVEFLLFLQVQTTLQLDANNGEAREVRITLEKNDHILYDGEAESRWRIITRDFPITDARALDDATHINARESVPVSWAVPLEGRREEAGRFWAFFPTHTQSYLPGILNAPWKLNSDRNAIIGGEWNSALMTEAAGLIAESLPSLSTDNDPARPLDAFPRQLDPNDDDAAPLVNALWSALISAKVIPDGTGELRVARDLWRHPKDDMELTTFWQSLAGDEVKNQFIHPMCNRGQRPSRLNALAERIATQNQQVVMAALRRRSLESWFALVASPDPVGSIDVLRLAERYAASCTEAEWVRHRDLLSVIPSEAGNLACARTLVLAPEGVTVPNRETVALSILAFPDARRILEEVFRIGELDDNSWRTILNETLVRRRYTDTEREQGWQELWTCLRLAPQAVSDRFIKEKRNRLRIRRRDGKWVTSDHVLLPGVLIDAADPTRNQNVIIDELTHNGDSALLSALRVTDFPDRWTDQPGTIEDDKIEEDKQHLKEWLRHARQRYYAVPGTQAARESFLYPVKWRRPDAYALLKELDGWPNVRLTTALLERFQNTDIPRIVYFGHSTRLDYYPTIEVSHPMLWFLLRYGQLAIGASTTVRYAAALKRRCTHVLHQLPQWAQIDTWLEILEEAAPTVDVSSEDIRALWNAVISVIATPEAIANDGLTELWLAAAKDDVIPIELPSHDGPIPLDNVFVTASADLAERARENGQVVVTLDSITMQAWLAAGAQDLAKAIALEFDATDGGVELIINVVPELSEFMRDEVRGHARCQPVTGLRLQIGENVQSVACLMRDVTLHLDIKQFVQLSRANRLRLLLQEIAAAGWLNTTPNEALRRLGGAGVDERRNNVAQGETLADKLLLAVGNRPEPLRQVLGGSLAETIFIRQCGTRQLAELVLSQLGPAALSSLRATLEEEGLMPPGRWNTEAALHFVQSIGFPSEFASNTDDQRSPEEYISGPIYLPPLHDFQEEVLDGLNRLLGEGQARRRAVVSLPTGGGKTRVTVEAAVRLVLGPESGSRSVVWIAQTEELCEQAVQAFRQVWVNRGAEGEYLRVVRLWGGRPNPAGQVTDKPVVVVASIQTLNNRFGQPVLDWLRKPGLVVVDECHHAITPSFTSLLRWLDAESPRPGASVQDEPPIVGLSATPFRTDDDDSQRLARRFNSRWLPSDQENLYERLREQGVLAYPLYQELRSGVSLTDEELEGLNNLPEPWEGLDFENMIEGINQRLAGEPDRNEMLVKFIRESEEQAILFFANSVGHAEEMAARLHIAGIPAAAVSGRTPIVARRYFLNRFHWGQVRVLCNHSVLATGFDAPKTDMVLIARQVFSPVRYMQMVGRGLRGEKNGGTATCRIVTVLDNLGRFLDRHPYHYCRELYEGDAHQHQAADAAGLAGNLANVSYDHSVEIA